MKIQLFQRSTQFCILATVAMLGSSVHVPAYAGNFESAWMQKYDLNKDGKINGYDWQKYGRDKKLGVVAAVLTIMMRQQGMDVTGDKKAAAIIEVSKDMVPKVDKFYSGKGNLKNSVSEAVANFIK